jgi:copper(I)-binding protein
MKKQLSRSILVASSFLLASFSGALLADAAGDISVSDAYVRATAPGQANSAAYLKLHNGSMQAYSVVGAEGHAAKAVELHTHVKEGDMMKMRRIDKIDVPAHGEVVLQPGGHHVMLIGLKQAANEGDSVHFSLVFNDGSKKMINAPVKKMSMQMGSGEHGGHEMHKPAASKQMDHNNMH